MANILASNSPPFHVIAIDMDGTLLNPEHEVTAFTKKTIQDVVAKYPAQVFVVLASGRQYTDLKPILDSLEIPEGSGGIIACNGARAYCFNVSNMVDGKDGESCKEQETSNIKLKHDLTEVNSVCIPLELVRQVLCLCLDNYKEEMNIHLYQCDRWLCAMEEKEILKYSTISGFRYEVCNLLELIQAYDKQKEQKCGGDSTAAAHGNSRLPGPFDGISKIFLSCKNPELLEQCKSRILAEIPSLSVMYSSKCFLEVMANGVSKLTGLQFLLPHLQAYAARKRSVGDASSKMGNKDEVPWLAESTCIAFGDNENDVALLTKAARGCLMGNSSDALKESLKNDVVIVGTNYEDGVAHEIRRVFKL